MIISELIQELQHQKELHGDIEVEIFASTDCGYSGGGGCIEDITFNHTNRYDYIWNEEKTRTIPTKVEYDCITLENNEG